MARSRVADMMQSYPFWVFDISGINGNVLFSIFDPVLGFSAVSAPEITTEIKDIKPGNWTYKRRVVRASDVGAITLSRGARFYDSDFYNWITNAIVGRQPVRRTLVLVQFLGWRPLTAVTNGPGVDIAAVQMGLRIPGRAWVLYDCVPTRYRAATDFDASSGDVSIMELEVQPEHVAELTVSTLSPAGGRAISLGAAITGAVR